MRSYNHGRFQQQASFLRHQFLHGQSELTLLRTLMNVFRPGDVMLADRLMCAWTEMVMLKQRGVDSVCRFTIHRKADFRKGQRLGAGDHIVVWPKPPKPRTIDRKTYAALPDSLTVRECCVCIRQRGFRIRTLVIATTLLDAEAYSKRTLRSSIGHAGMQNSTCGP